MGVSPIARPSTGAAQAGRYIAEEGRSFIEDFVSATKPPQRLHQISASHKEAPIERVKVRRPLIGNGRNNVRARMK